MPAVSVVTTMSRNRYACCKCGHYYVQERYACCQCGHYYVQERYACCQCGHYYACRHIVTEVAET